LKLTSQKPILGLSACVHGELVRFDQGHKKSAFCVDELGPHVQYQLFCPEVAIGLPVPRPTIRQTERDGVILVSRPDGTGDVTQALTNYGQQIARNIAHLSGFIFCQKSPSCGMARVKVYHADNDGYTANGIGQFAKQIMALNPDLPCEENGRLNDPRLRENFIIRIFTYCHWQELLASGLTKHKLLQFHSKRKYLLMSHDLLSYQALGQLLASDDLALEVLATQYIAGLMKGLSQLSNRKSHTNTLQHIQGYFKKQLTSAQKQELNQQIVAYHGGLVPLLVPLTLIKHYLRAQPEQIYLASQVYLAPYPEQLALSYGF
jgi:uncharacterized protein YbgA (DUF1722 family)/uncharacterized protein YbbK (DUF523 family)